MNFRGCMKSQSLERPGIAVDPTFPIPESAQHLPLRLAAPSWVFQRIVFSR